jgi:hypothetical protein
MQREPQDEVAAGPESSRGRSLVALALAAGLITIGLMGASPARADDEFGHGFKDELGRIAAQQAFLAGRAVLVEIFRPVQSARYAEPDHAPQQARYRDEPRYRDEERYRARHRRRERARHQPAEDCADPRHRDAGYRYERWEREGPDYHERYTRRESRY